MSRLLRDYAAYNAWANERLLGFVANFDPGRLDDQVRSSFPSLRLTCYHIWDAETIWLRRLQGASPEAWPSASLPEPFPDFGTYMLRRSEELRDFVASRSDDWFGAVCAYRSLSGEVQRTRHAGMVHHVLNHSTFHRGQAVTIMRTLGADSQVLGSSDLITWLRARDEAPSPGSGTGDEDLRSLYGP